MSLWALRYLFCQILDLVTNKHRDIQNGEVSMSGGWHGLIWKKIFIKLSENTYGWSYQICLGTV